MYLILLSIVFPVLAGVYLLVMADRRHLLITAGICFAITGILVVATLLTQYGADFILFNLTASLPICFAVDGMSAIFSAMAMIIFICAGFFSFEYMKHEGHEKIFFMFYTITFLLDDGF